MQFRITVNKMCVKRDDAKNYPQITHIKKK